MCAIFGAFGHNIDYAILDRIRQRSMDRGRDGGSYRSFSCGESKQIVLGAWRATPTTEAEIAPPQPYEGIVHNGTIANDRELGNPAGAVDSMILPKVLNRSSIDALASSLRSVIGSYALGIATPHTLFLAANYKPIYFMRIRDQFYFASMERHLEPELPWTARPQRLQPYTILDASNGESVFLPRMVCDRALVIASAGLDSTTAAYLLRAKGIAVSLLHFRYQCHASRPEALGVKAIAAAMGVPHVMLDIDYRQISRDSPLLGTKAISDGLAGAEFAHEWVPARNLLMIATAVAYAEANGFDAVALGNNLEEAGAYPDNEEEFTHLLDQSLDYAVAADRRVRLLSPVGNLMKHEIVREGLKLGVPYGLTWSCYRGGNIHCGRCGPCLMRKEAFARNGADDPVFACAA